MVQKLYYGGPILTIEGENDTAQALLVENDLIKYVGSYEGALKASSGAEMVDLKGHTLMPAFICGHGHFPLAARFYMMTADLSSATSYSDIAEKLREYIAAHEPGDSQVVVGTGYDHNTLGEKQHPTKDVLNQVSRETPICISHISGHMGCLNDAALKLCGIDAATTDPQGGVIGRIEGTLEPNGYLEGVAYGCAWEKIDSGARHDMTAAMSEMQKNYFENGLTTVQDGGTDGEMFDILQAFASQGLLEMDVVAYIRANAGAREIFAANPEHLRRYKNRVKLGGYKIWLDGSPQAKTAWMTKPYENSGDYCSYPRLRDEEVLSYAKMAMDDNVQLLAHCNGDAASDQLINQYRAALELSENPARDRLRPTMIHCQTVRDDQLDEMAKLGMLPSIFVGHTYFWGDVHMQNLGPDRGSRISPTRSALERDLLFNLHQDTPVTRPDMLHSIWCAVNRVSKSGRAIGPEQRIDVYSAIKASTINAAFMYCEEDIKGSLKSGKLADLIILDKNPLDVPLPEIKDINVLETIKEGRTVWRAEINK